MKSIGKYEILGTLGKGGMGIVYKALDPDIEREVAIKTVRFDTLADGQEKEDLLARVIREAKAAGRLNHPNIITIYDVIRDGDMTYIVMQYVDGPSLEALDRFRQVVLAPGDPGHAEARLRRPGFRPPERDRPPGHQAGQHPDR